MRSAYLFYGAEERRATTGILAATQKLRVRRCFTFRWFCLLRSPCAPARACWRSTSSRHRAFL